MKVLLPIVLSIAISGGSSRASFVASPLSTMPISSAASVHHRRGGSSGRGPKSAASDDDDDSPTSSSPFVSSDLKSLLPTPKKRTLRLDKFGRRVHDLTDDGTAKYSMKGVGGGNEEGEDGSRPKSAKEMAAEASSADFHLPASTMTTGADLKALLPSRATRKLSSSSSSSPGPSLSQILDMINDGTTTTIASAAAAARAKSDKERAADASKAQFVLPQFSSSKSGGSDLKALLPRQNTRFMKLDKFGRRVQRMEDDGTVNMMKEPSPSPLRPTAASDASSVSAEAIVDLDDGWDGGKNNYGSLKDLAPTRRETWTRLDFKGASIVDDRRTKRGVVNVGGSVNEAGGGNLRALLPKRPTWTKLDFKGGSVEDERRTRRKPPGGASGIVEGGYSNLKTLLPERTITWKKNQVLRSGSAAVVSSNARGLREERLPDIKYKLTDGASSGSDDMYDEEVDGEDEDEEEGGVGRKDEVKPYTNLKDLLPERKTTWRTVR
ncbi:hypothetical protein ACHAXA_007964 [Cyclostephanos tholiformis]|uniref:Uncharacterized protein n=1 Tax=Cyclostephanos tholiformis TaxID=382380 RepID=A0ABD3R971_9STRA